MDLGDTANIKKILGDNFAVAPYPTITLNGEQKQLEAFPRNQRIRSKFSN